MRGLTALVVLSPGTRRRNNAGTTLDAFKLIASTVKEAEDHWELSWFFGVDSDVTGVARGDAAQAAKSSSRCCLSGAKGKKEI